MDAAALRGAALHVRFRFEYGGLQGESERVSVHRSRDNFDGLHTRLHRRLSSGDPGSCFVVAHQPPLAVLDRGFRWQSFGLSCLFSLVLLALAAVIGRAALWEWRSARGNLPARY